MTTLYELHFFGRDTRTGEEFTTFFIAEGHDPNYAEANRVDETQERYDKLVPEEVIKWADRKTQVCVSVWRDGDPLRQIEVGYRISHLYPRSIHTDCESAAVRSILLRKGYEPRYPSAAAH